MKKIFQYIVYLIFICGVTDFLSCQRPIPDPPPWQDNGGVNKRPVADAGPDQTITLPEDSVFLDGSASMDPDGIIIKYRWYKIAGPESYVFIDSASSQTLVRTLVEGTYQFELKVFDDSGSIGSDVMELSVFPAAANICNDNRPRINVSLTQIGTLSQPRIPYVAAAGSKIVFAGGPYLNGPWYYNSSAVDIYDVNSNTWSIAALSKEREGIATVSCGNKIFFAGGGFWEWAFSNIDIYDVSTNTWTRADLSVPRSYLTAATVGNKVFFAGGFTDEVLASSRVDIYDLTSNTWTTAELSHPRYNLSAVTTGNKIYFAGGVGQNNSAQVDIYDNATNSWSTSTLQELSGFISGVAVENNIYWAGIDQNAGKVEIWNTADGSVTFNCLTYPRYSPTAVTRNDDVIFFTSSDWGNEIDFIGNLRREIDIYNAATAQWSVGQLPHPIVAPAVIGLNNSIYMGGGRTGKQICTDKVYLLNW